MELTLYLLLVWVSVFWTYLVYSKNIDQTHINKFIAGLLWMFTGFNSLVIHYYIPNGSVSSYTSITDNSNYWQIELMLVFCILGLSMWYQIIVDQFFNKEEDE